MFLLLPSAVLHCCFCFFESALLWVLSIPQSAYEGQIRTLMAYIDPKTDAFVVAGGDGTLMEVWLQLHSLDSKHLMK